MEPNLYIFTSWYFVAFVVRGFCLKVVKGFHFED